MRCGISAYLQRLELLTLQPNAIPLRDLAARKFHAAERRAPFDTIGSIAGLETELSISESQMRAWARFAETLSANARRLDDVDGYMETPFFRATFQVVLGGALVLAVGILIGSA